MTHPRAPFGKARCPSRARAVQMDRQGQYAVSAGMWGDPLNMSDPVCHPLTPAGVAHAILPHLMPRLRLPEFTLRRRVDHSQLLRLYVFRGLFCGRV